MDEIMLPWFRGREITRGQQTSQEEVKTFLSQEKKRTFVTMYGGRC